LLVAAVRRLSAAVFVVRFPLVAFAMTPPFVPDQNEQRPAG
jgi:hypothetical protein